MNATESAANLAIEFAMQLNATPAGAQNWSSLERNDDLPTGDYVTLRDQFGEVTQEMKRAYKSAFNATFRPIASCGRCPICGSRNCQSPNCGER
jgi:hypothetical protein